MKFKLFCALCLLFVLFHIDAKSQNADVGYIDGVIVDSTSIPIVGAVVALTAMDNATINTQLTDTQGYFKFDKLRSGIYKFSITHLSFQNYSDTVELVKGNWSDTIKMTASSLLLNTITVLGNRVSYKNGGYTLSMNNNALTKGKDVAELLTYLPFVTNVDGGFKIAGKSVGRIRINGMIINDLKELEAIRADNLENVEIGFSGISDEFDSGSAAEINISLKKMNSGGYLGSVTGYSSVHLNHGHTNSGINSSLIYNAGKVNIYNYLNLSLSRLYADNEYSIQYKDLDEQRYSFSESRTPGRSLSDRLDLGINLHKRHTLGVTLRFSSSNSTPEYTSVSDLFKESNSSKSSSEMNGDERNNQYQTSLDYVWKLDNRGSSFNIKGDYLRHETSSNKMYEYVYGAKQNDNFSEYSQNIIDNKVDMYFAKATLNLKLGINNILTLGMNYNNNRTHENIDYASESNGIWTTDSVSSGNYKLTGDNYAAFAAFSSKIGERVDYKISARYEHRDMGYFLQNTGAGNRQFFNNFEVSAELSYFINRNRGDMLIFSYESLSWPMPYSAITPTINYINEYSYTKGNIERIKKSAPHLTSDDLLFLSLECLQFSNNEITVFIGNPSVDATNSTHYRLKKKLDCSSIPDYILSTQNQSN